MMPIGSGRSPVAAIAARSARGPESRMEQQHRRQGPGQDVEDHAADDCCPRMVPAIDPHAGEGDIGDDIHAQPGYPDELVGDGRRAG